MGSLLKEAQSREAEVDPQLLDMLLSFTDFQLFRENMLESKKQTNELTITGQAKLIHKVKI